MDGERDDPIPVRALNQVSYCPRLYYLEYVDAVMPLNEHVEDGLFQHRRVNDPSLANRSRKEGETLRTRSVSLSSARLGISGKLDLLEEKGRETRPVEYKRSSAPRDADGEPMPWENDAIQLCAQGLLVEECLGVEVPSGVLYYIGSSERVEVPLDATLRAKTTSAIALIRALSARDMPPEPLPAELRHRCFGCSLAPICLPEETLYLIHRPEPEPGIDGTRPDDPPAPKTMGAALARVIPQIDEKAVLYLHEPGSHVGRRGGHLVVSHRGREVERVPIVSVRQVVVFGNVQVSTQAMHTLAEAEIPVSFLSGHGKFIAALVAPPAKNMALRAGQYRTFSDPSRALELSRAVVTAKISNQRTLLMRSLRTVRNGEAGAELTPDTEPEPMLDPSSTPADRERGPDRIRGRDEPAAREMAELMARVPRATDTGVLLGLEGQAAALYFGNFGRMLKVRSPGASFDFTARNRRPPRDPVNCLLSFAYAILAKDCFSAACTVGLDPYMGFYHVGRHGRPSLALDLMEEFRPVIADSVVLGLINNGMLTTGDFLTWRDACQLSDAGRESFFRAYEQRKATEVTHPIFGYRMSYGRMLEVQARMLAAYVRGELPSYVGFTVR